MKKLAYWFFLLMLTVNVGMFSSCKNSQYAAKRSQAKVDNIRKSRVRKSQKMYDKASKEHLNRQDKATKKRMEKHTKDQKKHYKNKHSKKKK